MEACSVTCPCIYVLSNGFSEVTDTKRMACLCYVHRMHQDGYSNSSRHLYIWVVTCKCGSNSPCILLASQTSDHDYQMIVRVF